MSNTSTLPLVTIQCLTYNHEPYIRQCLEGFVMQKTNFRFEAIVHDDASTDTTSDIIREYAERYPEIIKPIYETENQYSKHDGSLQRIMDAHTHGKYVAICEGDDYWIDPLKLQKQVDFMEGHPDHSLCFHAHYKEYNDGRKELDARYNENIEICPAKDIILAGGGYMATNSMLFRKKLGIDNYPQWAYDTPVGDAPLMLVLMSKGYIGYLSNPMSLYRFNTFNSWSYRINKDFKLRNKLFIDINRMWISFNKATKYKYCFYIMQHLLNYSILHIKFCMLYCVNYFKR